MESSIELNLKNQLIDNESIDKINELNSNQVIVDNNEFNEKNDLDKLTINEQKTTDQQQSKIDNKQDDLIKLKQQTNKSEFNNPKYETTRMKDYLRRAVKATSQYNKLINQERKDERGICLDLQTYTLHYPLGLGAENRMLKRNIENGKLIEKGKYPIAVLPGHFQNNYRKYTSQELKYFPINTVIYGPVITDTDKLPPLLTRIEEDSFSDSDSKSSVSTEHSCCCDEKACKKLKLDNCENKCECLIDEESAESESDMESDEQPPKLFNFSINFQHRDNAICDVCKKSSLVKPDGTLDNLIHCTECILSYHPVCLDMSNEIVEEIKSLPWLCSNCKRCVICDDARFESNMLICDLCDTSTHAKCIGLKEIPTGKWFCKRCSVKQKFIKR